MAKKNSSSKDSLIQEGTGTLSIRFNPKLRYQIELAGRLEHRSLSNFIESCIHKALYTESWPMESICYNPEELPSVGKFIEERLWAMHSPDRIVKLGIYASNLLDYEEQRIWKVIEELPGLWQGKKDNYGLPCKPYYESEFDFLTLRNNWENIIKISKGELKREELGKLIEEEIPF